LITSSVSASSVGGTSTPISLAVCRLMMKYTSRATDAQIAELLRVSAKNDQVCNAALCAQTYLPPLLVSHGHLLDAAAKKELIDTFARYKKAPAAR
jgi:hypothetical protein